MDPLSIIVMVIGFGTFGYGFWALRDANRILAQANRLLDEVQRLLDEDETKQ